MEKRTIDLPESSELNQTSEATSYNKVNNNKESSIENAGYQTREADSYNELKYRDEQEEKQPSTQPDTQDNNTDSNKETGNLLKFLSKFERVEEKTNGPTPSKNQGRDE